MEAERKSVMLRYKLEIGQGIVDVAIKLSKENFAASDGRGKSKSGILLQFCL